MTEAITEKHLRLTVVFILVVRASHDPRIGAVNIPFPFRIKNTDMNSGCYIVRWDNDQLKFRTTEDSEEIDVVAVTATTSTNSACGTLAFVECGRRYILCKAFWPMAHKTETLPDDLLTLAAVSDRYSGDVSPN